MLDKTMYNIKILRIIAKSMLFLAPSGNTEPLMFMVRIKKEMIEGNDAMEEINHDTYNDWINQIYYDLFKTIGIGDYIRYVFLYVYN